MSKKLLTDTLPPLLKGFEEDGPTVLWVAVSPSLYMETEIADYQAVNNPARPLDSLNPSELNAELVKIALQIKEAVTWPIIQGQGSLGGRTQKQSPGEILTPTCSGLRTKQTRLANSDTFRPTIIANKKASGLMHIANGPTVNCKRLANSKPD